MSRVEVQPLPGPRLMRREQNIDRSRDSWWIYAAIGFCLMHVPLALVINRFHSLSTLHALAILGIGMWWALTKPQRRIRVAYVGAYIAGAEVLWRMTSAGVFWEFGKYATASIFLVAIFRSGRLKAPATMLAFFALLIPSVIVTVGHLGVEAQQYLSFFMSGPFAMTVAAWFFFRQKLTVEHIQRIFLAAAGPIIGIASVTFFAVYTARGLEFTGESNLVASGGFGPNQVSSALGLGALFALMFLLLRKTSLVLKVFMLSAMLFMAVQSALTFSRGGLYNCVGAAALASIYLVRDARTRRSLVLVTVTVFVLGSFVILPRLESFTGGALRERFSDTGSTNRVEIALYELRVWREYPILGIGPGGSSFVAGITAHTEFTRLLAEHGLLGLVALLLLLLAAAQNIQKPNTIKGKAIAACLIGWSFFYMLNAAMRLVAPAFVFGLAFATVLPETSSSYLKVLLAQLRVQKRRLIALQRRPVSGPVLRANPEIKPLSDIQIHLQSTSV